MKILLLYIEHGSTEEQAAQRQRALARIDVPCTVFAELADRTGRSAWRQLKREALGAARAGMKPVVVVPSVASCGRRLSELVLDLADFDDAGVEVRVFDATDSINPCRLLIHDLANFERRRQSRLTREGLEKMKLDGSRSGKRPGRPRAGVPSLIQAGIERVERGEVSIRVAATAARCSRETFKRHLKAYRASINQAPSTSL